jgi:hypothetical protein
MVSCPAIALIISKVMFFFVKLCGLIYRRTLNVSILPNPKAAPPWPGATVTPPHVSLEPPVFAPHDPPQFRP